MLLVPLLTKLISLLTDRTFVLFFSDFLNEMKQNPEAKIRRSIKK